MDPIADMLTRIRNAQAVNHQTVSIPHSQLKMAVLRILKRENFIENFEKKGKRVKRNIIVKLRYHKDGTPAFSGLKRVSKPGRRIYKKASEIFPVKQGLGIIILSTPQGLVTNIEARKKNVGGEVICEVW